MKDIPFDSPFYSFREWKERTSKNTHLDVKNDLWLGLYLARKFDVQFVTTTNLQYNGQTHILKTLKFSDLSQLELFFQHHQIALYEIYQYPSEWVFHTIDQNSYAVTPLDNPTLTHGYFIARCAILKTYDAN